MLTRVAVEFGWPEPTAGHEWVQARLVHDDWTLAKRETVVLVPRGVKVALIEFWERPCYQPFKTETGLFRNFALLPNDKDSVLTFADRYGSLSIGRLAVPIELKDKLPKPPRTCSLADVRKNWLSAEASEAMGWANRWNEQGAVTGDTLEDWTDNIRKLKVLVRLWDALRENDRKALTQIVKIEEKDSSTTFICLISENGELLWSKYMVGKHFRELRQAAESTLIEALWEETRGGFDLAMQAAPRPAFAHIVLAPNSLRTAIWLQFAAAVCENKDFRQCEVCGKSFQISPETSRTSRTLCSSACKAKAHRTRQARALALAVRGKTVRQIATAVGSKEITVKGWMKNARKK